MRAIRLWTAWMAITLLAGCAEGPFGTGSNGAEELAIGHQLMQNGAYEAALESFTKAALQKGLTPDILSAMGTANLGLGRLGQAETLLRDALKNDPTHTETWNNLGVVLVEKGDVGEAVQVFKRAYALDNGESDSIRNNLRLALAKRDNASYADGNEQNYKLVRRGSSEYLIRKAQ